jgi:hypothetical protein
MNVLDQLKVVTSFKFFCLLLFEGTFTSFFKDKNHRVGIKVFLTIYFWIRIWIQEAQNIGSRLGSRSATVVPTNTIHTSYILDGKNPAT